VSGRNGWMKVGSILNENRGMVANGNRGKKERGLG
jgi:hypothetical protein